MNQTIVESLNHSTCKSSPKLFEFLNVQLRSGHGFSIHEEYPSLFGDYPGGYSLVATINGLMAGHVGFMAREFVGPKIRLKVGLIGSVVTAPEYRSRGIGSLLMQRALADLKSKGCLVACLWADDGAYYERFGFYRAGREINFKMSAQSVPEDAPMPIVFDVLTHTNAVWRLYQKHSVRLDRSLEEEKRLVRIPKARIFVSQSDQAGQEITSYIVINKGADFSNYIHEWGGALPDVQRNVAGAQKHFFRDQPLTLIAPASYDLSLFRALAVAEGKGVLGMMCVLDGRMLLKVYESYLRGLGISYVTRNSMMRFNKDEYSIETARDQLKLIFGDASESKVPNLPFFLWGFDSI